MARKNLRIQSERFKNAEEMFVSSDEKCMRRGRRVAPRTEACRPCLVWPKDDADKKRQGVVLDLNPYGLRVRMLEHFPEGTELFVQMMRDEEFRMPLSQPLRCAVVRTITGTAGFVDHGLQLILLEIKKPAETRPVLIRTARPRRASMPTRMYTANDFGNERGARRSGRNRG